MNRYIIIKHLDWASRYNRKPKTALDFLSIAMHHFDFVSMTEMERAGRAGELRMIPGADYYHRPGEECAHLWSYSAWKMVHGTYATTTDLSFRMGDKGGGKTRVTNKCCTVILEHRKTGLRVLLSNDHTPSAVEGLHGFRGMVDKVRCYRAIQKGWRKHVREVKRNFKVDAVIVCADWNLDWRKAWVRAYLSAWDALGLKPVWTPSTLPKDGGTINNTRRIIDGQIVSKGVRIARVWILKHNKVGKDASDHWGVGTELEVDVP